MERDQPTSVHQNLSNERFSKRNIPSSNLQPYLESRPVLTKYAILPVVDQRPEIRTPLIQQATYNTTHTFNPGNAGAPWSGFASNVNCESELRGQIYGLQKSNQSIYVPDSSSDLYKVQWNSNQQTSYSQPFPKMFQTEHLGSFNPNPHKDTVGYALFNNSTRQQLKEVSDPVKKI